MVFVLGAIQSDFSRHMVREQIGLDSWRVSSGLAWPRRLAIRQDGRRYFTLVLDTVTVELS